MSVHAILRQRVGIAPRLSDALTALERSPPRLRVAKAANFK
jgi:hypothetical protein